MADFSSFGTATATGTPVQDTLFTRNIGANRRVMLRRILVTGIDAGVAGWGVYRIVVTDLVTAAVLASWATALDLSSNAPEQNDGDRRVYFSSGPNGCLITASLEGANAGAVGTMSLSGKYQ